MSWTELNLFYEEPNPDRWIHYDRYPRAVFRRLVRGKTRPGGQQMVFINLCKGLARLGHTYNINPYRVFRKPTQKLACIVGKPQVLFNHKWQCPILFGASVFSHPLDCPDLLKKYPVKKILVPGPWIKTMFEEFYGDKVAAWPVGIDTDYWAPIPGHSPPTEILVYYKIRWEHAQNDNLIYNPILNYLTKHAIPHRIIKYGYYEPQAFKTALSNAKAAIFLCEHETQGLAYQQMLSAGVPVFAWDRGGYWQDPAYYPHKVQFKEGVSSVPYWDNRCGLKFSDFDEFRQRFEDFIEQLDQFRPRDYILENLTLKTCAKQYIELAKSISL